MKPLIGIAPIYDESSFGGYKTMTACMDYIEAAGGVPVLLPLTTDTQVAGELCDRCDGIVIAGGHDIEPARYGADAPDKIVREKTSPQNTGIFAPEDPRGFGASEDGIDTGANFDEHALYVSPDRDILDELVISGMLARNNPLLGICRGLQSLNVYQGGTLWLDLVRDRPGSMEHALARKVPPPTHPVNLLEDSPLAQLVGTTRLDVTSHHHQGVRELGRGLEVMATAPDGVIEAVWMPGPRFVWAVQWHPEGTFETDTPSLALGKRFVDECAR